METARVQWKADWVWYPGARQTVNFHFLARKTFEITPPVLQVRLHIFAFTDYKLLVNGNYLGRGPNPSDPYHFQYYDTYSITEFLHKGKNVIAIICHNYGIGVHWQPMGPGALIIQAEIESPNGTSSLVTDGSWKVKAGDSWALNSPRMFWSCGFSETFDFQKYTEDWLGGEFDDSDWKFAEVLGKYPAKPFRNLIPREIPFLKEDFRKPATVEKGTFKVSGFHAVSFAGLIPEGKNSLGYAQTYFYVEQETEANLRITCDDAFKAFLNDKPVLAQGYDEEFARTRRWYGLDDYEQHHYGLGPAARLTKVMLRSGWNKMLVVVDQGSGGWGFSLVFFDAAGGNSLLNLPFSNRKSLGRNSWTLAGPFASTGMNDSLDAILSDIVENFPPDSKKIKVVDYHPFDYEKVTDYAFLMQAEERSKTEGLSVAGTIVLHAGEFLIADFGRVEVGYPYLEVDSPREAIIDVGYNYVLPDNKKILFHANPIKYVDRIYLEKGCRKWEPLQRRTGRYLHLSCRKGQTVRIKEVGIKNLYYPVREIGQFESSDRRLNRIWDVSRYTTHLLMQYGYQDCLRREEGTCNMSSFNYMSRSAGLCFGDYKLARKTLKLAAMTQNDTGWFDSHGLSAPNEDEPAECLWWIVWLKDYYLYSGDVSLVQELFGHVENNLRFFAKMLNRHGLLDSKNESILRRGQKVYVDDTVQGSVPQYRGLFDGELFGYNILYYAALNSAAVLSGKLGLKAECQFYRKKAARVKKSSNERFWDPEKRLYVDWREGDRLASTSSQAILIAAAYFDICDRDKDRQVLDHLLKLGGREGRFENYCLTFGFYYYFLEVLFRHGNDDIALALMRAYYGRWLELGATTFGEGFALSDYPGKKDRLAGEYEVHGYGTSAHLHFYTNILGIIPLRPGFQEVLFHPRPGGLKRAKGTIHTPQGEIKVSWRIIAHTFKLDIEMPEDCGYQVKTPESFRRFQVTVNHKQLRNYHDRA